MSHRYTKSCDQCGNSFTTNEKKTRACSKSCAGMMCQPNPWIECSTCMAKIGLGLKSASKLIGIASFASIGSAWKRRGIARTIPAEGSWDLYARRRGLCQKTKALKVLPWWGDTEAASGWMTNAKARFPDWSYLWIKEKAARVIAGKHQAMTESERKAFNARCMENRKKRWAENPETKKRDLARMQKWKAANPEKNRESIKRSTKARKLRDPGFNIACNLRNRFKEIMAVARDPSRKWESSLIGCNTHQLAAHLESKFKRGMTWANYGTYWHVDHIMPCAAFDHTKPEQVRSCWHFSNLAPLEAKKNMAKGASIQAPQLSLLLSV